MNKQTSLMFFLVTLTFFLFVFSSSVNARIRKRQCEPLTYYCDINGSPTSQVDTTRITFTQFTTCDVRVTGQVNNVDYPNGASSVSTESQNYDVDVIQDLNNPDSTVVSLPLTAEVVNPFEANYYAPAGLGFPFTDLLNYNCVVNLEESASPTGAEQILGSGTIIPAS
ncbi:8136_t:CDS:1 [Ambispora leptoticha]|uniref:8136_t:CDS:1 n=1 Tax=Ambispora leptoticha TaxID=144679 RepID=A0A9N9CRZ2_9GLOM|nr:8136_t:CDS:1 [Ambispora leptoticha]